MCPRFQVQQPGLWTCGPFLGQIRCPTPSTKFQPEGGRGKAGCWGGRRQETTGSLSFLWLLSGRPRTDSRASAFVSWPWCFFYDALPGGASHHPDMQGAIPFTGTFGSDDVQIIQFHLITYPGLTGKLLSAPLYVSWVGCPSPMTRVSGILSGMQLWWRPNPLAGPHPGTSSWSSPLSALFLPDLPCYLKEV